MLSAIAAVLVGVWFYHTAARSGRSPLSWAISGFVVYFVAAMLWSLGVTPSIKDAANHTQSGVLVFVVQYAYIAFGLACAGVINVWLNKTADQ